MITRHVVIGGMKHCGKTTQGKKLAEFWSVPFFDTDALLEEAYRKSSGKKLSCREIFRAEGETFFRQKEAEVIHTLTGTEAPDGRVIALGGGVPANPFVQEEDIHKLGFFVFLDLPEEEAFKRVVRSGLPPFLESAENPAKAFAGLYFRRLVFYRHFSECTVHVTAEDSRETVFRKLVQCVEEA